MSTESSNIISLAEGIKKELEQLEHAKEQYKKDVQKLESDMVGYQEQFRQLQEDIKSFQKDKEKFTNECLRIENQREKDWNIELEKRRDEELEKEKKRQENEEVRNKERIKQQNKIHSDNLKLIEDAFLQNKAIWEEQQNNQRENLKTQLEGLIAREATLSQNEIDLFTRQEELRAMEESIQQKIENGIIQRKRSFEAEKIVFQEELERLRDDYAAVKEELDSIEMLETHFEGKTPQGILQELRNLRMLYKNEKSQRSHEVNPEILEQWTAQKETIDRLEQDKQSLEEDKVRLESLLQQEIDKLAPMKRELTDLENLKRRNAFLEEQYAFINEKLKRLQQVRQADLQKWYSEIETPSDQFKAVPEPVYEPDLNEIAWLNQIHKDFINYGYKWPKRILYAFHTALKIRDWSQITVLAGVSGTGKSKLPELYAHFGGINFYSVAVQPNWDSQQSMLGFFNSLENKFDSTPMLKLLAQSQKSWSEDYPGLNETQTIILLDEMNLAHIELYFADFLSKLEQRRGMPVENPPVLEIQLGPGQTYDLKLGNNVLWTGTMNQDETTKSLSDKVLDRGVVIYFPRPKILERIVQQKEKPVAREPLHRQNFDDWTQNKSYFSAKQISQFKTLVESINNYLAKVGRALGHRVWQSIEHYMANHPKVIRALQQLKGEEASKELTEALQEAFEDQLVQKVMPKLRGIESRGQGLMECLDPIKNLLAHTSLVQDFDNACNTDFGRGK